MKDFKFLTKNYLYDYERRIAVSVCGSTANNIAYFTTTSTAINPNIVMAETTDSILQLRDRIAALEQETRELRDNLRDVIN